MKRKHKRKPQRVIAAAKKHIQAVFTYATQVADSALQNRYVRIVRKIAMKNKVTLSSEQKRRFCSHCHAYFVQGENCRVRVHRGKVIYTCLMCKRHTRIPISSKKRK